MNTLLLTNPNERYDELTNHTQNQKPPDRSHTCVHPMVQGIKWLNVCDDFGNSDKQ